MYVVLTMQSYCEQLNKTWLGSTFKINILILITQCEEYFTYVTAWSYEEINLYMTQVKKKIK